MEDYSSEDYSPEALEKRYAELPEDVRIALSSEETAMNLTAIGEKHGLLEDRLDTLVNETGYVMLGLTHPSVFIQNLTTKMGISRENAQQIAEEVNNAIFRPIRDSLKRIHGIGAEAASQAHSDQVGALKKEDVLREIEDTPKYSANSPAVEAHAEKLQKLTASPQETVHIQNEKNTEGPSYRGEDPYREPL